MTQRFDNNTKTLSEERSGRSRALKAMGGLRFLLVVLVAVLALAPQGGHASPVAAASLSSYAFTVNTTADTHDAQPGDGVCADSMGQCSLRAAIEEADALPSGSSITITLPASKYPLRLGTLRLTGQHTVTINGAGSTTTTIKVNHNFEVMSISAKMSASLSQLTIKGGSASYGDGGGIYNKGMLTVSNSTFSGNSASGDDYNGGYGGGIFNTGTLTVSNSIFSGNSALSGISSNPDGGGGIANNGGTLTVSNSTFSHNSAQKGKISDGGGGGIYNEVGTLSVSNSTLSGNSGYYGGGIYNSGTLSVTNSTLSSNSAVWGGGIATIYGMPTVSTSTLSGNSANGGGGIYNDSGTLSVSNSTLSGNSAHTGTGGGIDNEVGTLSVTNSTLSGNSASQGGGIANEFGGTLSVSTSTVSGNSASSGGGIDNNGSTVTLTGTIVANSPTGGNCGGTISEGAGYNLSSDGSCGFSLGSDLNNTDPMLGALGDNGGPTQTMALLQGSKAIDWVASTSCPASDQRGYVRPDGSGESLCDIGAYESAY